MLVIKLAKYMKSLKKKDILVQTNKILSSKYFRNSTVLAEFLTYIVNETLSGRENELKEYTIAVVAMKKPADFNPQMDSIVRIHAARLRRALKDYFQEEGRSDHILIQVPK